MHRRRILQTAGLTAGAALLAACGSPAPGDTTEPTDSAGTPTPPDDDETDDIAVINASYETLAGTDRRFAFGLQELDRAAMRADEVEVVIRDVSTGEAIGDAVRAEVHPEAAGGLGIYLARIDVPDPGIVEAVVTADGRRGTAAITVIDPDDSELPVPGDEAVVTTTATTDDDQGLAELCTNRPDDCAMHADSLDALIAEGRPVALLFATPAYCQTAVCAPAVEEIDAMAATGDFGDVAFVHVEVFADAGQTLAEPVRTWGLPTEPWLFLIGRDGRIADRMDGALPTDAVAEAIRTHLL